MDDNYSLPIAIYLYVSFPEDKAYSYVAFMCLHIYIYIYISNYIICTYPRMINHSPIMIPSGKRLTENDGLRSIMFYFTKITFDNGHVQARKTVRICYIN